MESVEDLLDLIEDEVDSSKAARFNGNKKAVDANVILNLIVDIRNSLPVELSKARRIIAEHDKIIEDAKIKAEEILEKATLEAEDLVSDHPIYMTAQEEAEIIINKAHQVTSDWQQQTVEYVDSMFEEANDTVLELADIVDKYQTELRTYFEKLANEIYEAREKLGKEL